MSYYQTTSIAATLRQVLSQDSRVIVLDYSNSFQQLWTRTLTNTVSEVSGLPLDWGTPKTTLIIIGVEVPEYISAGIPDCVKNISFETHLTSLSWAAAWRIRYPESQARVCVVGTEGKHATSAVAEAIAKLATSKNACGEPLIPGLAFLRYPKLVPLSQWISRSISKPLNQFPAGLLRNAILEGLTSSPDSRHSVSNVVGAFLLRRALSSDRHSAEVKQGEQNPVIDALQQLLEIADVTEPSPGPWFDLHQWGALVKHVKLIDDMAVIWRPFLAAALGFRDGDIDVEWEPSRMAPRALLEFVSDENGRPIVRRSRGCADHWDNAIVFLDLRLFGTRSSSEDANFLGSLLELARQLPNSEGEALNLPWPGFERKELELITRSLRRGRQGTEGYHRALTLLPRLLAIAYPTLPIIIFSSTRQRAIIEALQPYGNIITDFHKPYLLDETGPLLPVDEVRATFCRAVESALKVASGRQIQNAIGNSCHAEDRLGIRKRMGGDKKSYLIEIFIDESEANGRETICVGGIVVLRSLNREGVPIPSDGQIWTTLKGVGGVWGHCDLGPVIPKKGIPYSKKGSDLNLGPNAAGIKSVAGILSAIKNVLSPSGGVYPLALIQSRSSTYDWLHPSMQTGSAERVFDITGRKLGVLCVEAALSSFLPCVEALKDKSSCIAIDFPTRQVPVKTEKDLKSAFGVTQNHLESSAVWGLLNELSSRSGTKAWLEGRVVRARAVQLQDYATFWQRRSGVLLPKQMHYLADWVAHIVLHHRDIISAANPGILEFFEQGFVGHLGQEVLHGSSLEAIRAKQEGRLVDAIMSAWRGSEVLPKRWIPSVPSLTEVLRSGNGDWFEELRCGTLTEVFSRARFQTCEPAYCSG